MIHFNHLGHKPRSFGQLGIGPPTELPEPPSAVESLFDTFLTKVVAGANHTLALTEAGEVFSWGSNSCGQLGHADRSAKASAASNGEPQQIVGLPPCSFLAASSVSAAVSVTGRLYIWGNHPTLNPSAPTTQQSSPTGASSSMMPPIIQEVAWLRPKRVQGIALGSTHALVVTTDQTVLAWGDLSLALGYPTVSKGTKVWASDAAILEAAEAEANDGSCRPEVQLVARRDTSAGSEPKDSNASEGKGVVADEDTIIGYLGASLERITSHSLDCGVLEIGGGPHPLAGSSGAQNHHQEGGGGSLPPLLQLRQQRNQDAPEYAVQVSSPI